MQKNTFLSIWPVTFPETALYERYTSYYITSKAILSEKN